MNDIGKFAGVAALFMGIGYFTGGAMTVHRHKNVLKAAQKGYAENEKEFKAARRALGRIQEAEKAITKAQSRGRLGRAVFGDEDYWNERRQAEKQILRMKLYELRARKDTMSSKQEKKLKNLENAIKASLPSMVEQNAVLGI